LISNDKVHHPWSSLLFLLISWSVSSSSFFIRFMGRTLAISDTIIKGWVGSSNIWSPMKICCLLQFTRKHSLTVGVLILLWIVISHLACLRFHVEWSDVGEWRLMHKRINIVQSITEYRENRGTHQYAVEQDAIWCRPGQRNAWPMRMPFEECTETGQTTRQQFIFIFLMLVLCCHSGNVRCTGLDGFFMPPISKC
jgi:hypothetical protein